MNTERLNTIVTDLGSDSVEDIETVDCLYSSKLELFTDVEIRSTDNAVFVITCDRFDEFDCDFEDLLLSRGIDNDKIRPLNAFATKFDEHDLLVKFPIAGGLNKGEIYSIQNITVGESTEFLSANNVSEDLCDTVERVGDILRKDSVDMMSVDTDGRVYTTYFYLHPDNRINNRDKIREILEVFGFTGDTISKVIGINNTLARYLPKLTTIGFYLPSIGSSRTVQFQWKDVDYCDMRQVLQSNNYIGFWEDIQTLREGLDSPPIRWGGISVDETGIKRVRAIFRASRAPKIAEW